MGRQKGYMYHSGSLGGHMYDSFSGFPNTNNTKDTCTITTPTTTTTSVMTNTTTTVDNTRAKWVVNFSSIQETLLARGPNFSHAQVVTQGTVQCHCGRDNP